jgi:hypothetical protein
MASRGTYLSRAARRSDAEEQKEKGTTGLSRKSSVTSTAPSSSKIPTSSWFSRSKHPRAETGSTALKKVVPLEKSARVPQRQTEVTASKTEPVSNARAMRSDGQGLGISSSTYSTSAPKPEPEHRQRNVLRRKAPSRDQHSQYAHTDSSTSLYEPTPRLRNYDTASTPAGPMYPSSGSVFGVALPPASSSTSFLPTSGTLNPDQATSSSRMAVYNKRRAPQGLTTQNLPPPTPSFAYSSGSSTRRSESPSTFSRTSTPTSMSSHSPSVSLPAKSPLKTRQMSPTRSRPPVTRWRIGRQGDGDIEDRGLAPLRESVTSSSSSSTVKGTERAENTQSRQTSHRLSPTPPSPPSSRIAAPHKGPQGHAAVQRQQASSLRDRRQGFYSPPNRSEEIYQNVGTSSGPNRLISPPPRPSREGTPKLDDYIAPSPVIQSNLSRLATTGHKRRESIEKAVFRKDSMQGSLSGLGRSASNASNTPARPSRLPSPNPSTLGQSTAGFTKTRLIESSTLRIEPPSEQSSTAARSSKDPSPQSASLSKSSTRFGLFSRRTRSPMDSSSVDAADKGAKKGPAAGTGHEGYGKYARRGRTGSISTSASRGRSTSTSGTASSIGRNALSRKSSITSRDDPEMDDFLRERLTPVYLSGGGMVDSRESGMQLSLTSSGESLPGVMANDIRFVGRPPFMGQTALRPATASPEREETRRLRHESRTIPTEHEHLSDDTQASGDSLNLYRGRPTLAARRSQHRSQVFAEAEPVKIPAPINTRTPAFTTMDSYDTMPTSALRTDSTALLSEEISEGREGNWLRPRKKKERSRSPKKWNFFQRAVASPKKSLPKPQDDEEDIRDLPATISRLPDSRPVPFYAMLDTFEQDESSNAAGQAPMDSNLYSGFGMSPVSPDTVQLELSPKMHEHKTSMLLPSPPTFPAEFLNSQAISSPTKVISRQPEPTPASEAIVSEPPKPRVPRLQQIGRIPRVVSKRDRLHKPPPQSFSRPFARQLAAATESSASVTDPQIVVSAVPPVLGIQTGAIAPDPRGEQRSAKPASAPAAAPETNERLVPLTQDEFLTFPTRKFSQISGSSSSGAGSFSATVATTAIVPTPGSAPDDDEIWNEYNDFLDTVSPAPLSERSASQSDYLRKGSKLAPSALSIRRESPPNPLAPSLKQTAATNDLPQPPSMSTLLTPRMSGELVPSPMSFSEFFAGYADRNRMSAASKHQSYSSGSRYSTDSIKSRRTSGVQSKRYTQIMVEKTENASDSQSNLRFSALMTSRWLSFGRVLFSPAHNEIQANKQDRVLVLDGLGNDDWSFYCALTYPNATIYNLSPSQRSSASSARKREIGAYDSPPNHRQIFHTGFAHPFPFPKAFFSAAVFRFPVTSSEAAYTNAISEFKRVLQPGGYLELSILDLDMVNMGNRARRAVRMLKVRMQVADPDVSLKPNSDNIQKMLGRRGFENLKSCMVDVPVAGHISSSRAGSIDEENKSLGDMLKDSSTKGDESITKMVAKVGRWWYSRCYEVGIEPDMDNNSIWTDRQLLRECEKRETGLKLLVCHAQKPNAIKRRTVSM